MVTQTMLVFHAFNIRVRTLLCDGASCNLSFLKLLCGSNEKDDDELASIVPTKPWFVSPREEEVYLIICPSHQVIYLLTIHIITHSILVWLKNMIAALYSSKTNGTKDLCKSGVSFGWKAIEDVFQADMKRAKSGLTRRVPGLKYSDVVRDSWTRLNVLPAKIMQVCLSF